MAKHLLISIPASHYCERARWALDFAGIPFSESKWPPMLHYLDTVPAGAKSVPVLKCPATPTQTAQVLKDSTDIVRYAHERMVEEKDASTRTPVGTGTATISESRRETFLDQQATPLALLYPSDPEELRQVLELEQLFARKLGVWTRVVAYHHLFADKTMAMDVLALRQHQAAWKNLLLRAAYPVVRGAICRGLRVDERGAAACLQRIHHTFQEVGDRLARNGGRYLVGRHFTAADLTFAAMAAPVLAPEQYGAYLPPLAAWGPDFPAHQLRHTPAGLHALRMYELHRHRRDVKAAPAAMGGAGAPVGGDVGAGFESGRTAGLSGSEEVSAGAASLTAASKL